MSNYFEFCKLQFSNAGSPRVLRNDDPRLKPFTPTVRFIHTRTDDVPVTRMTFYLNPRFLEGRALRHFLHFSTDFFFNNLAKETKKSTFAS